MQLLCKLVLARLFALLCAGVPEPCRQYASNGHMDPHCSVAACRQSLPESPWQTPPASACEYQRHRGAHAGRHPTHRWCPCCFALLMPSYGCTQLKIERPVQMSSNFCMQPCALPPLQQGLQLQPCVDRLSFIAASADLREAAGTCRVKQARVHKNTGNASPGKLRILNSPSQKQFPAPEDVA